MTGKIKKIASFGDLFMYLIWIDELGKFGRTYTGPKYRNYDKWRDLKIGDSIENLDWKNKEKGIIDADSDVHLI